MAIERARHDPNRNSTIQGVSNDTNQEPRNLLVDPATDRLLVSSVITSGSGLSATVTGNVASLATDSGNPVKVGGVYNTTLPTATSGQRLDWQFDVQGGGRVYLDSLIAGEVLPSSAAGDAIIGGFHTGVLIAGMVYNSSLPTPTNGQPTALQSDSSGRLLTSATTKETRSTTGATATVAASITNVTLVAANGNRLGAMVTNQSSATLYLKLGATASTTSFTVALVGSASAPYSYYEVPFNYTGIIDGIWDTATGNARITELT